MERLHIAFFGPANSGKSTLVNAICGQEVSLVSPIPGTTTDPVRKAIEIPGLGPCVVIDTAGLEDGGPLGAQRERLTRSILEESDVAVYVEAPGREAMPPISPGIPVVRYRRGESVRELIEKIKAAVPEAESRYLTGSLVKPGDTVVLVMPQDGEAPKGRLILPQVRVIRELLDRWCVPVCCTPESLARALGALKSSPALVITDSQVFGLVNETLPGDVPLTSFSILLAAEKGDIGAFVKGAEAIGSLREGDRVLIAEACTHVPATEDIGRVKIPAMLRRKAGPGLGIDIAAGNDFPEDLSPYSLIIHCGACVASRATVRSHTQKALLAGVPITNYGIAIAFLQGILGRVSIP